MSKRSINEILDAPFSGDGDSQSHDYHTTLVALREAQNILRQIDLFFFKLEFDGQRKGTHQLLKKWSKHA